MARYSAYKHANNPLFDPEEAYYWDTLELPADNEYKQLLAMTKTIDRHNLYIKIGFDSYNAFMLRLQEDDPAIYETYTHINQNELPF